MTSYAELTDSLKQIADEYDIEDGENMLQNIIDIVEQKGVELEQTVLKQKKQYLLILEQKL